MREALLKLEPITPSLKQQYDKEIEAMLQQTLTVWFRRIWLVAAVASLGLAVWLGWLAATAPSWLPLSGRLGLAGGAIFSLFWAALGVRVFQRGSLDLKVDMAAIAGLTWGMPVLLVTCMLIGAPDNLAGLRMITAGIVFLIGGAVFLIGNIVQQAELRTREKMLQIEYRLAGLAEALGAESAAPPFPPLVKGGSGGVDSA
jgi:hypothetical protein